MSTSTSAATTSSASASSVDYSKMSMADLRKELQSKGLKTSGKKKQELVDRLQAASGGGAVKKEPKEEVVEETDFSKAKIALAAKSESKKKGKKMKMRKVDEHCYGTGQEVYEDWDCMLNQTNIGHNNNKFYVIQLLKMTKAYVYYMV